MVITSASTCERLQDDDMRAMYGAETLKYAVAALVVNARKKHNLSQSALAQRTGVSQAYIAKLESGEANPTLGRLGAILASIWVTCDLQLVPLLVCDLSHTHEDIALQGRRKQ